MKLLLIGTYLDQERIEKYNQISQPNSKISIAATKYSKLISRGFEENLGTDSQHLFFPPIGTFPSCRKLVWSQTKINDTNYVPFVNIIFLKQVSIFLYLIFYILNWSLKHKNDQKIIVFTFLYLPFLFSIAPFKLFKKIKFVSFVPDIPEYEFSYSKSDSVLKRKMVPLYIHLSSKLIGLLDYFIFITKYMKDIFPDRPYSVMEGLVDKEKEVVAEEDSNRKKAIMYSGALFEKFGIFTLLNAFSLIEGDYELWLFGSGDAVGEITDKALTDHRIKYFGSLPNHEVLKYQKKALLLVNPRYSTEDFTKFSFPSKLMEYLSSGTATLTTRLPGIPADYADKFYFIEDESAQGFKEALEFCLNKNKEELKAFGSKGRLFVQQQKNYQKQTEIILNDLRKFIEK